MADFDDADPAGEDEFDNEDEEMEDANEPDQEPEAEDDQNDEDEDDNNDEDENDADEDEDEDQNEQDSPSNGPSHFANPQRMHSLDEQANPSVVLTSPSPRHSIARSPNTLTLSWIPSTRPEALTAQAYDIVPTMAAPQSTSINAVATTPDMKWVISGGTDGYVRMYNWVDTANGKVPLTVAQKHPFVDSVMKAGSLVTYWENKEGGGGNRTPPRDDDGKWTSPVYSLAVQHEAVWLLSGLESGGINMTTCRHQAGTRITTLREHTSAVSVLNLSQDELSLLSGSWDKNIHDWDLQTGKVKRSFKGCGSQISALETRPMSDTPIPEVAESLPTNMNGTFSSNNADAPATNGFLANGVSGHASQDGGDEDAAGSPSGSLFGENDHGSLFGDDTAGVGGGGGIGFGDENENDDLTRALASGLQDDTEQDAPGEQEDTDMGGMGSGGPVQAPDVVEKTDEKFTYEAATDLTNGLVPATTNGIVHAAQSQESPPPLAHTLPHTTDEPLTAPPTDTTTTTSDLPPQSNSTFLSASIDGVIRLWDRRISSPIATLPVTGSTPPWATGACWSPDGNYIYVGRRNCTVEEYSIHTLSSARAEPNRSFRFQAGSGPVYAVRAMPNKRHLVCASNDILRIYDLAAQERGGRSQVPFTIVPGHRGGVISSIFVDPSCRFMLSAAGNRGWEGNGTEVLLGYEIGTQDAQGVWSK